MKIKDKYSVSQAKKENKDSNSGNLKKKSTQLDLQTSKETYDKRVLQWY